MSKDKDKSKGDEPEKKPESVVKNYRDRLKLLKKAHDFTQNDDIPRAVECYGQYLNSVSAFYGCSESDLHPKLFDTSKDLAELLLMSQAYWNLAKAYDRSPNLHLESIRCLDQFAKFTIGFKYQYGNAQLLKNFINKRQAHNVNAFKATHDRIRVESKGCFLATDIYGSNNCITHDFRTLKLKLSKNTVGRVFIRFYYTYICPFYFKFRPLLKKPSKILLDTIHNLFWGK